MVRIEVREEFPIGDIWSEYKKKGYMLIPNKKITGGVRVYWEEIVSNPNFDEWRGYYWKKIFKKEIRYKVIVQAFHQPKIVKTMIVKTP